MTVRAFGDKRPHLDRDVFVDDTAVVIGDVHLNEGVSIWPNAVLRADDDAIVIGRGSAVLDLCMIEAPRGQPVSVGDGCIISHKATLHGCTIGSGSLVGIGATVLDGAELGNGCVVAAGAVVTAGMKVGDSETVMGIPGKITRRTTEKEEAWIKAELDLLRGKADRYRTAR